MLQQEDEGDTPTQRVIILAETGQWRVHVKTLEVSHPDFKNLEPKKFAFEAIMFAVLHGIIDGEHNYIDKNLEEIEA
jgi:hypothetical protein